MRRPAHRSRLAAAALATIAVIAVVPSGSALAGPAARSVDRTVALAAPALAPGLFADVVAGAVAAQAASASDLTAGSTSAPVVTHSPHLRAAVRPTAPTGPSNGADAAPARPTPKASSAASTNAPKPHPTAAGYHGRNHVWMPALGISRSIAWYPCSWRSYPGLAVYRWGCAGANNVYLFAHAFAAFKPLHDAYVHGRLRKGMKVMYADGSGRVRTYAIQWWRLTTPDKGGFAFAAQSRPSLTLQTCVGARSQYRLIVRLVQVG